MNKSMRYEKDAQRALHGATPEPHPDWNGTEPHGHGKQRMGLTPDSTKADADYADLYNRFGTFIDEAWQIAREGTLGDWDYPAQVLRHLRECVTELKAYAEAATPEPPTLTTEQERVIGLFRERLNQGNHIIGLNIGYVPAVHLSLYEAEVLRDALDRLTGQGA